MSWIDLGALEDIPLRGSRKIRTAQGCVALFRTAPEQVFAVSDRCPHKGGPLSDGIVHGQAVSCPLHGWVFDLASGQAQGETGSLTRFDLRIEAGRVLIDSAGFAAVGGA